MVTPAPVHSLEDESLPRWQRWLLPAVLGSEGGFGTGSDDGGRALPRSPRDWLVDLALFGLAVLIAGLGTVQSHGRVGIAVLWVQLALGLGAAGMLWLRRRHPLTVAACTLVMLALSVCASGAALVAVFTLAVHCQPRRTLPAGLAAVAAAAISAGLYGPDYDAHALALTFVGTIAAIGVGLWVRVRRELVLSLRERARRLEDERDLHVREARLAERTRIAREMHDTLAHRISLLSVHAGALEFNRNASPEEVAHAAHVIRVSARAAQEELREVIGVLRADADADAEPIQPPQPTFADLEALVQESREAGMPVTISNALHGEALPPSLGRTVYRVTQEALTNVRKHAPDQIVTVTVTGDRVSGIALEVVNRPRVGTVAGSAPEHALHVGSGTGLVGLTERIALAGGELASGPLPAGGFRIGVKLPWDGSLGYWVGSDDEPPGMAGREPS